MKEETKIYFVQRKRDYNGSDVTHTGVAYDNWEYAKKELDTLFENEYKELEEIKAENLFTTDYESGNIELHYVGAYGGWVNIKYEIIELVYKH